MLGRNRIETTGVPRPAAGNPGNRETKTPDGPVAADSLLGIVRARRLKPAAAAKVRAQNYRIQVYDSQEDERNESHSFRSEGL
jgi:hypothetical protein